METIDAGQLKSYLFTSWMIQEVLKFERTNKTHLQTTHGSALINKDTIDKTTAARR